ncbi:hypothetical protein BC629DRAFT_1605012 [Irpex lacteus]|nr:hypothetical protein BC629DRAFT_1605012 [Irpex lacteus]
MSASDRLIPTETNPVIDKSLPPTPAVAPAAAAPLNGKPVVNTDASNGHTDSNGVADTPPKPTKADKHKSGQDEKKALMERFQPAKDKKPTDQAEQKGDRWAKDPVTGGDVLIRDPKLEGLDNAALDSSDHSKAGTSLRKPPAADAEHQDPRYPAPVVAQVGNIALHPFPPPVAPVEVEHAKSILRTGASATSALCFVAWIFTACGKHIGWLAWFVRSSLLASIAVVTWIAAENAGRKIEKEVERVRWDAERRRADEFSPPTPESVEWLNALLKLVWGLINPDMFVPIVDMVEDILQASLPGFVDAVRIADIGQGTNPLRIVSMRALPDQPGHPDYPREEWVGLDKDKESKNQQMQANEGGAGGEGGEGEDTDQTGDYLNYEISLSYQALPGQQKKLRFHNIHLMLEFFVGAFDWFKIPIPIYAVVEGFVATARMRIQFVQQPPFVRNLTVTLMGVPKVEVSVEPFTKKLPNVLDLPMIQKFVEMGIAAALAQYIAPKSLTLNLAQLLAGANAPKDTKAIGVLVITVHHAVGLAPQDRNYNPLALTSSSKRENVRSADPYIVLAYAKFGKPLYTTRIVEGDLNPVWEETAVLLVTEDEVKGDEDLGVMLWDSDKRSADDLVGRVTVPVVELMKDGGKMHKREDKLRGFEDANDMPGTLFWEVGYYEKVPLNQDLKKDANANVPEGLKDKKELQDKPSVADTQAEADALRIPPDPAIPTGILSIIIHQINNLERQDIKGNTGARESQGGQDTSEPAQEGSHLPNSYCEIIVNDDMIYKTRVKQYSSMPYFEAGTERFVRDWRETVVRVQVRDARVREKDPVLGVVTVKLEELFKNSSEVTRLFSLQEGIGYGRANISFMFRQVKTELPREMLGWETGTLEVVGPIHLEPTPEYKAAHGGFKTKKLEVRTTDESDKLSGSSAQVSNSDGTANTQNKIRLPVYNRYSSAVQFQIGSGGIGPIGQDADFFAVWWFKDLPDDEETTVRIPVLKSGNQKQLRQNYINDQTAQTHKYEVVGYLTATLVLDSGLDPDHEDYQKTRDEKHRYEAYDRVEGQAAIAERTAELSNKDDLTRKERKEIDAEKQHQLAMRHRGVMQYQPARTGKWTKEGLKRRMGSVKAKIMGNGEKDRGQVESEA